MIVVCKLQFSAHFNHSSHRLRHVLVFWLLVCNPMMISIVTYCHHHLCHYGKRQWSSYIDHNYPVIRIDLSAANRETNINHKNQSANEQRHAIHFDLANKLLTSLSSAGKRWVVSNGHFSNLISGCCFSHFTKCVWMRLFKMIWHLLYGHTTVLS